MSLNTGFKLFTAALLGSVLTVGAAQAGAIISNGAVSIGVNDEGHLNVGGGPPSFFNNTTVGVRDNATGYEATSNGCLCEGWGAGIAGTGVTGFANIATDGGVNGMTLVSFVSGPSTATSVVNIGTSLQVTHAFAPSASPSLFQVNVSITNTSGAAIAAGDLRYTRTFDWDVDPTTFNEFVTIQGTAAATAVLKAIDNGFVSSNPFATHNQILAGGTGDFVDHGPGDIGSNFDFAFGALGIGETQTFKIFYGVAADDAAAITALAVVEAEVYSLGKCNPAAAGDNPCKTFIFGFAGVGGDVIIDPSVVPLPAAAWMFLTGLAGIGGAAGLRKRRAARKA